MKIQLALGQKLTVGFYIPAEQQESSGWRSPEDQPLDGQFVIEYRDNAIVVSADLPDDEGRGGTESLNDLRKPGISECQPIIYLASFGDDDDDDAAVDA